MLVYAIALMLSPLAQAGVAAPQPHAMPGEEPIDPYKVDPANAGAQPFGGDGMARAFHGQDGIRRIVDRFIDASFEDPHIGEIFQSHDRIRLKRTLFEQFCFILNAGCNYSGRDMKSAHQDLGTRQADLNRLVEVLQAAMKREGVAFAAQNRFLAKLAPMRGDVVEK